MGAIKTQDARGLFTKALIDVYKEMPTPTSFLRSFFETKESSTLEVSIEVRRGTEKVASDVLRGTDGNRNEISRSSEKLIVPPYYREYIDATQLDFYDVLFGGASQTIEASTFADYVGQVAEDLKMLQDKIDRAAELQCAQVLETGIVTLNNGTNIDYKRKAGSLVDLGGGNYWDAAINPLTSIEAGCKFLRTTGKAQTHVFNMIIGDLAFGALLNNSDFKDRANLRRVSVVDLSMPSKQAEAIGGVFHGEISAGPYRVRLWTYPEYYDVSGVSTPYVNQKKAEIIPDNPRFKLAYGAVPMLRRDQRNAEFPEFIKQTKGAYVIGNYVDPRAETHIFDVKSAPLAVPVAVDQIYTMLVLA